MAEFGTLSAELREKAGKGTARAARRNGRVPAVIYGNQDEPLMITVPRHDLEKQLATPGFLIRLIDIQMDGQAHRVLPRDTQFHPVTDVPLHVDFLRYSADRKVTVDVPVTFENEEASPGLKVGGVINVVRHAIEVLCTADRIPEGFTIDLTGLEIGDSIHASSLALPEGVEFTITDRDFTIATIAAPSIMPVEEEEEAAEGAEGETAEGEADEGETEAGGDRETKEESGD